MFVGCEEGREQVEYCFRMVFWIGCIPTQVLDFLLIQERCREHPIQRIVCGYSVCHLAFTVKEPLFVWICCQPSTLISRVGSWTIYTLIPSRCDVQLARVIIAIGKFGWIAAVAITSFCLFPFVCFSLDVANHCQNGFIPAGVRNLILL